MSPRIMTLRSIRRRDAMDFDLQFLQREKMLLFICIFGGTLFTPYTFLIYIESGCEWRREKM
ncbi:hypothetical protein Hanom_Chr00s025366g01764361 [Helianthus anomalus]